MVELNFKIAQINPTTGKPILNVTTELVETLGLKKNTDLEKFRDQIPDIMFVDVVDLLFDKMSLATNKEFAAYNNMLIDIRNANKAGQGTIDIDKADIALLKSVFEKGVAGKPELNRTVGFVLEVFDSAVMAKTIDAPTN